MNTHGHRSSARVAHTPTMLRYKERETCPKCENNALLHRPFAYRYCAEDDEMEAACQCGFVWRELPSDRRGTA